MQGEREVGTGSGNKWPWCSGGMGVVVGGGVHQGGTDS